MNNKNVNNYVVELKMANGENIDVTLTKSEILTMKSNIRKKQPFSFKKTGGVEVEIIPFSICTISYKPVDSVNTVDSILKDLK